MKKVALLFVCLNSPYWPYLTNVINDCKKHFLPNHKVDILVWTDASKEAVEKLREDRKVPLLDLLKRVERGSEQQTNTLMANAIAMLDGILKEFVNTAPAQATVKLNEVASKNGFTFDRTKDGKMMLRFTQPVTKAVTLEIVELCLFILDSVYEELLKAIEGAILFDTEPAPWPMPTLMRYHLFLQQEEKLKDYDQLFYMDADMRVPVPIGEEIFSEGLTMAEHPMYAISRKFVPPYEPNPDSKAFIQRFGMMKTEPDGVQWYKPLYAAGGFQGGNAKEFITAMQILKKNIDKDFGNNYVAIWNDESHWNKYLSDYHGPLTVLDPSYVYPDSLIKEYYEPVWGRSYTPKIVTLTKPFTTTKLGGDAVNQTISELKQLK